MRSLRGVLLCAAHAAACTRHIKGMKMGEDRPAPDGQTVGLYTCWTAKRPADRLFNPVYGVTDL